MNRVTAYVAWCQRRRRVILLGIAALLAGGIVLAQRLQLRTSFAELLPSSDPGVIALRETQRRVGDISVLIIGVRSPDRDANLRFAQTVTTRLSQLPKDVCELAAYDIRDLKTFVEQNRWLYLPEAELESIRDRLRGEINRRKNPLLINLGEEESLDEMKARLSKLDFLGGRFADGYFTRQGGEYLWIVALPPGGLFVENAGEALAAAANRIVSEVSPQQFHPDMRVHVGGPVMTAIENRRAVERDIIEVTAICIALVALSIGIYFRRVRAVPLVASSAMVGTVLAFAVAELAFGYLNSSTAFLGSIIVGNGINYAIVLMARYEEERAAAGSAVEALTRAVGAVWKSTLVASIAAAASYASLTVTSFRGFSQFGVMGAAGCLICWVVTFTLLPALLLTADGGRAQRRRERAPMRLGALGRLVQRRPAAFMLVSLILTAGALLGSRHFLKDPFEYDFRKLNTRLSHTDEARAFDRSIDDFFGRWPSPTVVLADSVGDVEKVRTAIRRQDAAAPGPDVIGDVVTVFDLLPGTTEAQQRRLGIVEEIRRITADPALVALSDDERQQLMAATPPEGLRVLQPQDLPPLARRPFTEIDGALGRVVLVYPVEKGLSVWNGKDLQRIASVIQRVHLGDGRTVDTAGSAVVFGSMIRSIVRDAPVATAFSLGLVVLVAFLALRPWRYAVAALLALGIGIAWMIGVAGWLGVRITFINFIALPITFGIAVEYAINVIARYRERNSVVDAVAATGGAVALCSLTTIIGYGSLLAAQNQALQGFGSMAILGEIACVLTAIVSLPAALALMRKVRK